MNTFTGSYSYSRVDIAIPGRGPAPFLVRSYNSLDARAGALGPGWTHNYAMHLAQDATSGNVTVTGPQGRNDLYTKNPDGSFTPRAGVFATLVKNADGSFTLTQKDRSTWSFDGNGRLVDIADRYGDHSRISLNSAGQPASISDPAGRGSLIFEYDASGRLTRVTDWAARAVSYGYDANGRLQAVTDRTGAVTTFAYDGTTHHLVSISDANTHVALTMTYDSRGRVATQKDARGLVTGDQTTINYTANADGTRTTTVTYPSTSVDASWRAVVEDTYDTNGFVTKRVTKPSSSSAEWATTIFTYDANGDRTSITDARGNKTEFCYDKDYGGNQLARRGNLTRRFDPIPPGSTSQPITLFSYDAKDNLTQVVLPKGLPTNFNNGPVQCNWILTSFVNPLFAIDLAYDAAATQLRSITRRYTDPELGQITATSKYEYGDAANPGRITRVIPPRGNTGATPDPAFATTLAYYGSGSSAGLLASASDPLGNKVSYTYDAVGRRTSLVDPIGNASGASAADHTWTFDYDAEDRVRFARAPAPVSGGAALVTEVRYDAVGNRITEIDPAGQVTAYAYDVRDLLASVRQSPSVWTDPAAPPADVTTSVYQYDAIGKLTRVVRASGDAASERATDYAYDGLGRLRRETQYPEWPNTSSTLVTLFTYDLVGNRAAMSDPLGQTTTLSYDALNRVSRIDYSSPGTADISYTYDVHGNRTTIAENGFVQTTYTYDEMDRLLSANSVGYRYDRDGDRTKIRYDGGSTSVTYTFDAAGRLASLTDWKGQTVSYDYFADGRVRSQTNVNGTTATYVYDNARRLTDVWNRAADGGTISRHTYSLDPRGQRIRADEVLPALSVPEAQQASMSTTYGYDRLGRLVSAVDLDAATTYVYDAVGNRVSRTRTTTEGTSAIAYTYDRADRIRTAGATTYTVDSNGNVVSRTGGVLGADTFAYDQANRLIRSSLEGEQVFRYTYDGDGNRRSEGIVSGLGQTLDVNRALPIVLNDQLNHYVWGLDLAAIRGPLGTTLNGTNVPLQLGVVHTDGLGSVRALTAEDGSVFQTYRTDEFGVPIDADSAGAAIQPFQFSGEQRDLGTGLIYLRSRYYDPDLGRFISRDPLAGLTPSPQTLNRYTYAGNDPVDYRDPSGLCVDPGGPGVRFCIDRFIRQGSVGNVLRGDNRGAQSDGGTYRLRQFIWLSPFREEHFVGTTVLGDDWYRGQGVVDICLAKKARVLGGNIINAVCAATLGFLPFLAPPLGYHITIYDMGTSAFVQRVFGTGFPAMEVWRYEGLGTEPLEVFYSPGSDWPFDLYDPRVIFEPSGGGGGDEQFIP